MNKFLFVITILLCFIASSCSDEPQANEDIHVKPLITVVANLESKGFNTPANPPEYIIINSARELTNFPNGTLATNAEFVYSKIDFAQNTLIVVTTIIYCESPIDDDSYSLARVDYDQMRDYQLNIKYSNCSVMPSARYSHKCKMQFGFSTDKIPSDAKITITESLIAG